MFETQPSARDVPSIELRKEVLQDLEDHYFRYLGVNGLTEFYMARTNHDDTITQGLCFIAVETTVDIEESKCTAPEELGNMVLQLESEDFSTPLEAFLVPDNTQLELPEGWSRIRNNVVIVTDPHNAPQEIEGKLAGPAGPEKFTLQRGSN